MTLYALKPQVQALLRPAARVLHHIGITANQVTIGTCVVSIALGAFLAANADALAVFCLLPVWCVLRMALNALDGVLAREFGQSSRLGAILNEITDPVADAALYGAFAFIANVGAPLVVCVVVLSALTEVAAEFGATRGARRRNDGPMGKSDRAFVFGVLGLMLGCGVAPGVWLEWALAAIALLLVATIANRVLRGAAAARAVPGR